MSLARLTFWEFFEERLAMKTRKEKHVMTSKDRILQMGEFDNVFPEDDPDTCKLYSAALSLPSFVPVALTIFYRYSGSSPIMLSLLAKCSDTSKWTQMLKRHSGPLIRTDAYHNNWGAGIGKGRSFFTQGTCHTVSYTHLTLPTKA